MEKAEEKVTIEIDPKEILVSYLEVATEGWLKARARAYRDSNMNSFFNRQEVESMGVIDHLLDEYNALGQVAVSGN